MSPIIPSPLTRHRRTSVRLAVGLAMSTLLAVSTTPAVASAQLGAGVTRAMTLQPTSKSDVAVSEFTAALHDVANVQPVRALAHLQTALDADPALGIVRAYRALYVPGLTRAERTAELDRAVTDAARSSTAELLVASALRARFAGAPAEAQSLFRSAASLVPQDPHVAYNIALLNGALPGRDAAEAIGPLRSVTTRFPDYAAAYNTLAYNLYRVGDRVGAMEMVKAYVEKLPGDPNPHDSYAELLQWDGRLEAALPHYRRALQLDPSYGAAATGIAEVYVIQGKYDLARAALSDAMPGLPTPAAKLSFRRQVAIISMLEGNAKLAMSGWGTVAGDAKAINDSASVQTAHLMMAMTDAMLGNGKSVGAHVAAAGNGGSAIGGAYWRGMTYAMANQNTAAQAALADLEKATAGNTSAGVARLAPSVRALILLNERKVSEAITEIGKTDLQTPMTRAILALAQQQAGDSGLARSLSDEVLGDRAFSTNNIDQMLARRMVMKVK